jgi:hypothetical protein
MSLINDALRRASQPQPKRDPNQLPTMQPTYRPIRTGGPGFSILIVCFLIAALVTFGAWIYWKRGGIAAKPVIKPAPTVTMATPNTNNNPIARAARTLNKVDAANKEGEQAADSFQVSKPAAPGPAAVATAAPVAATPAAEGGPKLQGIFFGKSPSALVNGKSVHVGDEVDGMKIVEITKQSVRIQTGSETRDLKMK